VGGKGERVAAAKAEEVREGEEEEEVKEVVAKRVGGE